MSLRPADRPSQERPARDAACPRCASLEQEAARLRSALDEARAAERRASRRVELLLRVVPESAIVPLRHQLVDDLNRALHAIPGLHGSAKRVALAAKRAGERASLLLRRR